MSTTSEITPAETNPKDLSSTNNPSEIQTSIVKNQTPDKNSATRKQDLKSEANEASKPDPKAENSKPHKHRRALTWASSLQDLLLSKWKKKPREVFVKRIVHEKDVLSSLIVSDVEYIKSITEELPKYNDKVNERVAAVQRKLEELKKEGDDSTKEEFWELKKTVTKLKLQIPTKNKLDDTKGGHQNQQSLAALQDVQNKKIPARVLEKFPELHKSNVFEKSPEFKDFEARYDSLGTVLKLCLLCFSVFPDNAIINKRLMIYWWMAEGFVPPNCAEKDTENVKTAEECGNEYFYELMKRGFIEPANKKKCLSVKTCRMQPFIRSALVMIADRTKFFNFDGKGEPRENFSGSLRACLVGNGLLNYEELRTGIVNVEDLEKLHLVFNVNEHILEFKTEWFLQMKNVNILYLGRWKMLATDHIEVEETEFLDGLNNMKHLKFFSLQGVSRITELPESVLKLPSLEILDLRACHNLETLPAEIGLLRNLTHLDMSECYLLEHMPKSLAMLVELRVLKGFVVAEGKNLCTLEDLAKLTKLEKLSIYTGLLEFPSENHVVALQKPQSLRKLTMAWGGGALHVPEDQVGDNKQKTAAEEAKTQAKTHTSETPSTKSLRNDQKQGNRAAEQAKAQAKTRKPKPAYGRSHAFRHHSWNLEKLDLKCFPKTSRPEWLSPSNLRGLKKLYIRGGKFSDLGQYREFLENHHGSETENENWDVKILRVKYLNELEMEWREVQELFPELIYLEKVSCPKLTYFPCDATGVWINKVKVKESPDKIHIFSPGYSYQ